MKWKDKFSVLKECTSRSKHKELSCIGQLTALQVSVCRSGPETKKNCRTKLSQTMVCFYFQLQFPKFVVILVAGCLVSKIFQSHSETSWTWLQLVTWSCELHTLVTMFIPFDVIFGSSIVNNWERYHQIHFSTNILLCYLYQNDSNLNSNPLISSSFCFILIFAYWNYK